MHSGEIFLRPAVRSPITGRYWAVFTGGAAGGSILFQQKLSTLLSLRFVILEEEGYQVPYLGTDSTGIIDLEELKETLREDTVLVSVMYVNNETGAIQPVEEVGGF